MTIGELQVKLAAIGACARGVAWLSKSKTVKEAYLKASFDDLYWLVNFPLCGQLDCDLIDKAEALEHNLYDLDNTLGRNGKAYKALQKQYADKLRKVVSYTRVLKAAKARFSL
jgi:hypothetical protein